MGVPTTAIQRFDLSMTFNEFSLEANRRGYIALQVMPPVPVSMQSAQFQRVQIESVLTKIEDTERDPDGTYKRDSFTWTPDSYATAEHGVEEPVSDRLIRMYGSEIRAEAIKTERAINRLLQALEADVASSLQDTAVFTGALAQAAGTVWSTASSATPITNIDDAAEKVKLACGHRANALIVTDIALKKMIRTAQVQDLLKSSGRDDPKNLQAVEGLKSLLMLDFIFVTDAMKNTADKGQAASLSRTWDKTKAMVCRVATEEAADLESAMPSIGRIISWTGDGGAINALPGAVGQDAGVIIEEYREENRRGGVIRARMDRVVKRLHPEAGCLITGVLS